MIHISKMRNFKLFQIPLSKQQWFPTTILKHVTKRQLIVLCCEDSCLQWWCLASLSSSFWLGWPCPSLPKWLLPIMSAGAPKGAFQEVKAEIEDLLISSLRLYTTPLLLHSVGKNKSQSQRGSRGREQNNLSVESTTKNSRSSSLYHDMCSVTSVESDSLWPHGLSPTRLLCP